MAANNYPEATCMNCGKECNIWEEVKVGTSEDERYSENELWCYCPECDIETFHPIPVYHNHYKN